MEGLNRQQEKQEFFKFLEAIEERVNEIGTERRATGRAAQAVAERLFRANRGDANSVTDEQIGKTFDELAKERKE